MKKLNNKGMTTIEILISFVLVALISSIIYGTVSNFNNKRQVEEAKLELNTYKNILTKDIQNDLIKIGITEVKVSKTTSGFEDTYTADFILKDNTKRKLVIKQQLTDDYLANNQTRNCDDKFSVEFGNPDIANGMESYPIPDVGQSTNKFNKVIKDIRLLNVRMSNDNYIFTLFLGFSHPDFNTRYAINITCPINYVES